MRRVPPSVLVHEELEGLLKGGAYEGTNIVSALVNVLTRLVLQALLEADQADFLGGRAATNAGDNASGAPATATSRGASARLRGRPSRCASPR
jgi:hypothetical protein